MKTPSLSVFLTALVLLAVPAAAAPDPNAGKVVFVDGDVTANDREIDTGDVLSGATVIKTAPQSTVEVVFAGRNVFRVGPGSVVRIDFNQLKKTVNLDKGEFTSVLKNLARTAGDPAFVVRTPTVNAGVRGTSFHVTVSGNSTYVCDCNGSVDLDDGQAEGQTLLTAAHHDARLYTKQDDGTITVTEAGLQDHTDADIETLGSRVGYSVDWSQPDMKHN